MQNQNLRVMAVDDDDINLEILIKNLKDYGYQAIGCSDGEEAWKMLKENPEVADIILLDKMMPRMGGMEVLAKIQKHEMLKNVPVIIQTGDVGMNEVKSGLASGAYYYLCKPFDPGVMIALVNAAARDCVYKNKIYREMKQERTLANMISQGRFTYQTISDALKLAAALSHNAAQPERVNTALLELMINAVEHGNLNIGHELKGKLLTENAVDAEIERRLKMPENIDKIVEVQVKTRGKEMEVTICDEGHGFNWQHFIEFDPLRLTEPNGRGIATARLMGVNVEYVEPGNKVVCRFRKA